VNHITDRQLHKTLLQSHLEHKRTHSLNVILHKQQKHSDLAGFLHGCCGSPVPSTFITAIKNNNFLTWPGLTATLIKKHLQANKSSAFGHLHQEAQGLQSTKPKDYEKEYIANVRKNIARLKALSTDKVPDMKKLLLDDIAVDAFPKSPSPNNKTNAVIYSIIEQNPKNIGYIDLTGRFPYRSQKGNQYILVSYHVDANHIFAQPLKNRESASIVKAWDIVNAKYEKAGSKPETYIVDNEASTDLKHAMSKQDIKHQLVPPHNHRANLAERAIQTFKNHFVALLTSVNPDFPLALWDLLLPQANLTLNLLRTARSNPNLSAHAYLFGNFDFLATPLAPPGTRVIAFKPSSIRSTWVPHGDEGWYVGPALEHYRCVNVYFPSTRTTRTVDTVRYFPHTIPFPKTTLEDHLRQASSDIVALLANPPSKVTPELQSGSKIHNAILELSRIFNNADTIPALPAIKEASSQEYTPLPRVQTTPLPRVKQATSLPRVPEEKIPPTTETTKSATLPKENKPASILNDLKKKPWQRTQVPSNR
jgi:hypothetical protein